MRHFLLIKVLFFHNFTVLNNSKTDDKTNLNNSVGFWNFICEL